MRKNLALILIVIFAFVLRVVNIESVPPALNWDEASHGYNAYSVLTSGEDEWGERFPLIFRSYGDYKLPVYIYLTSVSILFFGLTEFAVRFPSVIAGVSYVVFVFFLTKKLFEKKFTKFPIALLAAFVGAAEPWSLFLSRGAFEANVGQVFLISGVYFFLVGLRKHKFLAVSSILLGLSMWSYNSERIFAPLIVCGLLLLFWRDVKRVFLLNPKAVVFSIALMLLFFVPMLFQLADPAGQARYSKVAILDEGAIARINELRAQKDYSPLAERVFYNKATYFAAAFLKNWISYFDPNFLFVKGGSQYQYNVVGHGLEYLVNIPFLLIGLGFVLVGAVRKNKGAAMLLFWLVTAPIAASITRDSYHSLRVVTMLPLACILIAIGVCVVYRRVGKVFLIVYILVLVFSLANYLSIYRGAYREEYSWAWQYGHKEAVEFVRSKYDSYDKIIFTKKYGEPHIFLLFWWPWDPVSFRNDGNLIRYKQSDWYWVDGFDKFYFVNDWEIPTRSDQDFVLESGLEFECDLIRCLLVTSQGKHQPDWKLVRTIYFLDGKVAFEIYEN